MSDLARTLILFGATGDLARRMLLPSLYNLDADGLLAHGVRIIGTARSELSDGEFRRMARDALAERLDEERLTQEALDRFAARLSYVALDASMLEGFDRLAAAVGDPPGDVAIFLSTAPFLFEPTIAGLQAAGLTGGGTRIGLEKPLGHDLASSRHINDAVAAAFPEERIFRIDHYLGKETVQNLLALRFANVLFEPLWNAAHVAHVQITVSETVGLEGRAGFYDDTGALRDMVQNHMLQLLSLIAMEPPATYDATAIRDEKVKVLRSLRPIGPNDVKAHTVIGQYTAGAVGGQAVPGYTQELETASTTETFVAVKAHVDNWRWAGVPFYLRTGKRLPTRQSEIAIRFKALPHSIFGTNVDPNDLVIRLQPEEYIRLLVMAKRPGLDREGVRLQEVPLDLSLTHAFAGVRRRIAYERLLLDLIEGEQTLFVRRDEQEAAWGWIDGIRAGWAETGMAPAPYGAGNWGPSAAIALAERDGVSWHD